MTLSLATLATSAVVVTLAEIGDKTMLLAIVLAARLRRPWAIVGGILVATIANHLASAWAGSAIAGLLDATWFKVTVALGFLAMAAWTLVPDKLDEDDELKVVPHGGAFLTTLIAFFLVEIGDKTQIATVALGARYHDVWSVAAGTTIGMMIADAPAVFLGHKLVEKVPLKLARAVAAAIFAALGLWQLFALL